MFVTQLIDSLKQDGIQLKIEGGKLYFHPKSAMTPDMLHKLRQNKQQILVYLIHEQCDPASLFINPPGCHNPFTPHSNHEFPWECDPNSCHCYQYFGYPRYCQGVPCRWIWPRNVINSIVDKDGEANGDKAK